MILLPANWKRPIVVAAWGAAFLAFLTSILCLPPAIGIPSGILGFVLPVLAERAFFLHKVVLIPRQIPVAAYPALVGSCLFSEDLSGHPPIGFGIVFETRRAAKETYSVLREWGKVKSTRRTPELCMTFVDEGRDRYSVFVYPRLPYAGIKRLSDDLVRDEGKRSVLAHVALQPYWQFPVNHTGNPDAQTGMDVVRKEKEILLNVFHINDEHTRPVGKGMIVAQRVLRRDDLDQSKMEYHHPWFDAQACQPVQCGRMQQIKGLWQEKQM